MINASFAMGSRDGRMGAWQDLHQEILATDSVLEKCPPKFWLLALQLGKGSVGSYNMSYSLNPLKGVYIRDYIGKYCTC